jgi:hypothetical protein
MPPRPGEPDHAGVRAGLHAAVGPVARGGPKLHAVVADRGQRGHQVVGQERLAWPAGHRPDLERGVHLREREREVGLYGSIRRGFAVLMRETPLQIVVWPWIRVRRRCAREVRGPDASFRNAVSLSVKRGQRIKRTVRGEVQGLSNGKGRSGRRNRGAEQHGQKDRPAPERDEPARRRRWRVHRDQHDRPRRSVPLVRPPAR